MKIMISLLVATGLLLAKDKKEEPKEPPKVSDALRAKFWRAALEKAQADKNMEAVNRDMIQACGADYQLQPDQNGEPSCVVKPSK